MLFAAADFARQFFFLIFAAMNNDILVSICCLTYNHESCLRQCLDGFLAQQTDFGVEVIIHDDASTDKTKDIILEYQQKRPDMFKTILQTENQYSKGVKISRTFVYPQARGKYIALCEGDDYWTDPLKLQKQADIMRGNPDITLCATGARILSAGVMTDCVERYAGGYIPTEDMIVCGGGVVKTATLMVRKDIVDNLPECCVNCHVGDFPLQIFSALSGRVYYLGDITAVYRYGDIADSWTSRQKRTPFDKLLKGWLSEISMLKGLDEYSKNAYHNVFMSHMVKFVYVRLQENPGHRKEIIDSFRDIYSRFGLKYRLKDLFHRIF